MITKVIENELLEIISKLKAINTEEFSELEEYTIETAVHELECLVGIKM